MTPPVSPGTVTDGQYTPSVVSYIEGAIATGTIPPMINSHVRISLLTDRALAKKS